MALLTFQYKDPKISLNSESMCVNHITDSKYSLRKQYKMIHLERVISNSY